MARNPSTVFRVLSALIALTYLAQSVLARRSPSPRPRRSPSPSRTPSQQGMSQTDSPGGLGKGASWRIEFGTQQKWVNPLMGWTSTADPYENVGRAGMSFDSAEAARAFCEKHGWRYTVKEGLPSARLRPARFFQYGDNFSVKRKGYPEGGLVSENGGSVEVRGREGKSGAGAGAAAAKGKGKK